MNLIGQSIAVIGLGCVGLPLAVEFGKRYPVVGFDVKPDRIAELQAGCDSALEVPPEELAAAVHLRDIRDPEAIRDCRFLSAPSPRRSTTSTAPTLPRSSKRAKPSAAC